VTLSTASCAREVVSWKAAGQARCPLGDNEFVEFLEMLTDTGIGIFTRGVGKAVSAIQSD